MGYEVAEADKADQPRALRNGVDERRKNDVLHPGSDGGTQTAEPHRAEVAISKDGPNRADLLGIECSVAINESFLGFAAEFLLRCELVLPSHRD